MGELSNSTERRDRIKALDQRQVRALFRLVTFALAFSALGLTGTARANGGVNFIAGRYYFDLSYGKVSLTQNQNAPTYEFYWETRLPGSTIWKVHFRSILRIEFPSEAAALDSLSSHAERAKIAWNRSHTRLLASFDEYAFILTPQFNLETAYRNTENAQWLNDKEIQAIVEVGGVSKYDTDIFRIDVSTDRFRRIR